MISPSKTLELLKRFRELDKWSADLDYQQCVLYADLRKAAGSDKDMIAWLTNERGFNSIQCTQAITRARAMEVVTDEATFKAIGGYKGGIARLVDFPPAEQLACIQQAKLECRKVTNVIAIRHPVQREHKPTTFEDCAKLAWYIRRVGKNVPSNIQEIVARYTTAERKRA